MPEWLIIKPSSLGDIVHGLQVAQSLKMQRPDFRITWVARDCFVPLVRACLAVDRCWSYPRYGGARGFIRLLRQIRCQRFDGVIDFQGLARSGLMLAAAQAARKIGRSDAREGAGFFYREQIPLPARGRASHAVDILAGVLPLLGCRVELMWPLAFRMVAPRTFAKALLHCKPIVMFPDSRRAEKIWPGFVALAESIYRRFPERMLVWAGQTVGVKPNLPGGAWVDVTGRTTLGEMVSLIAGACLVIANDSAPVHLAAALQVPVVALFGPTDPQRFGPYPLNSPGRYSLRAPGRDLSG